MTRAVKASRPTPEPPKRSGAAGVTLPPIDASPEEIAQALFQRPPLKKPKAEEDDDPS